MRAPTDSAGEKWYERKWVTYRTHRNTSRMTSLTSLLPPRPLTELDQEKIRAREEIAQFTVIDSAHKFDPQNRAGSAVVLTDSTIVLLKFDAQQEIWTQQVVANDATQIDHLEVVLRLVTERNDY